MSKKDRNTKQSSHGWEPYNLPAQPTFSQAKDYVRGLMLSPQYSHHLDDGVECCFEGSQLPQRILEILLRNEDVLWSNFSGAEIWEQMCPSLKEMDAAFN